MLAKAILVDVLYTVDSWVQINKLTLYRTGRIYGKSMQLSVCNFPAHGSDVLVLTCYRSVISISSLWGGSLISRMA